MLKDTGQGAVLLCGRKFTEQELNDIQETVRMFPKLSQLELAQTVCENLGWLTPNGGYKTQACLKLLRKLHGQGFIELPSARVRAKVTERVTITSLSAPLPEVTGFLADVEPVGLEPVFDRGKRELFNEYIQRYHYLGYKRPFGAHQRYFILSKDKVFLGCLLFAASAWALQVRDRWIGWTEEDRSQRLHLVVNNTRFLIFPWVKVKNLASRVLSLAAKRIRQDWQLRYNYQPVLLETFVDGEKYSGTCYRAANWIYLGETAGRGRMDRANKPKFSRKRIYVYPLVKDFRVHLLDERGDLGE